VDFQIAAGGTLVVRVDPRGFFANVDFATLPAIDGESVRRFTDGPGDQASTNLYGGLRASVGTYSFNWLENIR
jgi:hypothetical protein